MDHTNVSRQRWHDHWLFLNHFRKSPRTVGAIAPSSRRLARAMLDGLSLELRARRPRGRARAGHGCRDRRDRPPASRRCRVPGDRRRSGVQRARWSPVAADRLGLRPGRATGGDRPRPRPAARRSHRVGPAVCQPARSELRARLSRRSSPRFAWAARSRHFSTLHAYGFPSAVTVRRTLTREMGSSPSRTLVLGNLPPALVLRWRKH